MKHDLKLIFMEDMYEVEGISKSLEGSSGDYELVRN